MSKKQSKEVENTAPVEEETVEQRASKVADRVVESMLSFVGLGPNPGEDKDGYLARVWPNDSKFHQEEMGLGIRNGKFVPGVRQSSCAIVYERALAEAGFTLPMKWKGEDIPDALDLSLADRLNKFSPPLYPVVMGNEFFRQNDSLVNLGRRLTADDFRDQNGFIVHLFAPGNCVTEGGSTPGIVWGKRGLAIEHVKGIVSLDGVDYDQARFNEDEAFADGYIFVDCTVVEGGQPGVLKNACVFVLCFKRGEIWVCDNRTDATPEADWRPRKGRRVSSVGILEGVAKFCNKGLSPCSSSRKPSRSPPATNSTGSLKGTPARDFTGTTIRWRSSLPRTNSTRRASFWIRTF